MLHHRLYAACCLTTLICFLFTPLAAATPARAAAPAALTTRLTYDVDGRLASRTDANGAMTGYDYNALSLLTAIHYPDGSSVSFAYDKLGHRTQMTDTLGSTLYEYDVHSWLASITDAKGHVLRYEYNLRGLPTQLSYADGRSIRLQWDADGLLTAAEDETGVTRYEYDAAGWHIARHLPNGLTTRYGYDNAGRLTSIQHTAPDGSLLLGIDYALDALGRRTQVTRSEAGHAPQVTHYAYDSLSRLIRVEYPDGEAVTYQYDLAGNRTGMTSSRTGITRYSYDSLGRLVELNGPQGKDAFRYDANGNLIERLRHDGSVVRYGWDYENRLVRIEEGANVTTFGYDGDGRRLTKTINGRSIEYIQQGGVLPQVLMEITGDQEMRSLPGMPRTGEIGAQGPLYYLEDGLGSVVGLADASGHGAGSFNYDAFGAPRSPAPSNAFGFTGEEFDQDSGLLFLRARYYDPALGRFLSPDPFPATAYNPQTLNRYVYAANDPTDRTDPLGLLPCPPDCQQPTSNLGLAPTGTDPFGMNTWPGPFSIPDYSRLWQPALPAQWQFINPSYEVANPNSTIVNLPYVPAPRQPAFLDSPTWKGLSAAAGVAGGVALVCVCAPAVPVAASVGAGLIAVVGTLSGGILAVSSGLDLLDLVGGLPNQDRPHTLAEAFLPGKAGKLVGLVEGLLLERYIPSDAAKKFVSFRKEDLLDLLSTSFDTIDTLRDSTREILKSIAPEDDSGGVGGVRLDKAAEALVNLNDISSATIDPATSQVILIGRHNLSLPPMNMDDLVVAIRSVYAGQDPGMTMVPEDPSGANITQRVEYFGFTQDTHMGLVMFEADRYLKSLAAGKDTLSHEPVQPGVPGYRSELELSLQHRSAVPWHRNWFVPGKLVLKQTDDGKAMVFDQASIVLQSRFIKFLADGTQADVAGSSPVTDDFTAFVTNHYAEFAAQKPELAELVQFAKIVGLVKWLRNHHVPVDLSWVGNYQLHPVETPLETPGVVAQASDGSFSIHSFGGVDLGAENTVVADDGQASALSTGALSARPADGASAWQFEHQGDTYQAVALNLAPVKIAGGYSTAVTDAAVALAGGLVAQFTRQYNSLDPAPGPLGRGWSHPMPSVDVQRVPAPGNAQSYFTQIILTSGTSHATFVLNSDGLFRSEDPASPFAALGLLEADGFELHAMSDGLQLAPDLPGARIALQDAKGKPVAYAGLALQLKNGHTLAFDSAGRLLGERDAAGNVVSYRYEGEQLVAIEDAAGHGLQLKYGPDGHISDLIGSDHSAIHYDYDTTGDLITVSDETGNLRAQYGYDGDGHLARISNGFGQLVLENSYDGLGRVMATRSGQGDTTRIVFDDQSKAVVYTDAAENTFQRQYDSDGRLVAETDPWGNTTARQYDQAGRLTGITTPDGQTVRLSYDDNGQLADVMLPLEARLRLLNYNSFGLPEVLIDPAQGMTLFKYDDQGNITAVEDGLKLNELSPDGSIRYDDSEAGTTTIDRDVAGRIIAVHDPEGSATRLSYDEVGNMIGIQSPSGRLVHRVFDSRSRLTEVTDADGRWARFGYGTQGQLATIWTPTGQTTYDIEAGLLSRLTDPLGNSWQFGYGPAGQLTSVSEPGGSGAKYEFDNAGSLAAVVDATGARIEYEHDALGRLAAVRQLIPAVKQSTSTQGGESQSIQPTTASSLPAGQPTPAPVNTPSRLPVGRLPWLLAGGTGLMVLVFSIMFIRRRSRGTGNGWF